MFFNKYLSTNSNKASEISFLRMTVATLLVIIVVEGFVLLKTLGLEKIVIVPPTINRSFWLSGTEVSKDYLEQMAYWYAGLVLNATPATGEYQKQMFLRYATPSDVGRLTTEAATRLEYLARNSASTLFTIEALTTNEGLMKVALTGSLSTFVGEKRIENRRANFVIGFAFINGRLYVKEFKETNEKDIFGTGAGK